MSEQENSVISYEMDPVLMAVLANRLNAIVREMSNTLLRTARSAVLAVVRDFSCSIVTADNDLLCPGGFARAYFRQRIAIPVDVRHACRPRARGRFFAQRSLHGQHPPCRPHDHVPGVC